MNNPTFFDVYPGVSEFASSLQNHGYYKIFTGIDGYTDYISVFYSLMSGRKGNNQITTRSEYLERWKLRFEGIFWQWGPSWMKNLNIQDEARKLSTNQIRTGSLAINSSALNPSQEPATQFEGTEIPQVKTLDSQTTTQYRKGYAEAFADLQNIISADVTEPFLRKFDALFKKILSAPSCCDDEEEDNGE